jgi:hypothetical protein
MEPEGSRPCSQQPATSPDPQPDTSTPHPPILFFKVHFNVKPIHYSRLSSKQSLSFSLQRSTSKPRTNFSYPPWVQHACPSHPPEFENPKIPWSSSFCIFLYPPVTSSFNANASSWTHYSRIPVACSYLCVSNQASPPYNRTNKITVQIRRREAGKSHLLNASHLYYSPVAPVFLKNSKPQVRRWGRFHTEDHKYDTLRYKM